MKGGDREEFREVGQAGVAKRKGLPEPFPTDNSQLGYLLCV